MGAVIVTVVPCFKYIEEDFNGSSAFEIEISYAVAPFFCDGYFIMP